MGRGVEVVFDHAQTRIKRDRISALVQGLYSNDPRGPQYGWSQNVSDCWIDPLTQTLMLEPAPLAPEWITTGTGIYARTPKSGFTFVTSAKWAEITDKFPTDYWIEYRPASGDSHELVTYSTALAKNRGVVLGWFNNQKGGDDATYLECGFGDTPAAAAGVSLRIFPGGGVEVYKGAVFDGDGTLDGLWGNKPQKGREFYRAIILPYRRRDLLILLSDGTAYRHTFSDIAEDDADPTITPNEKFWFQIPKPSGASQCPIAKFQFAPLSFATSGSAVTRIVKLHDAPPVSLGRTVTPFVDVPGYGVSAGTGTLTETDGTTSFVPDGTKTDVRLKIALTGDGTATRFFYAAEVVFDGETAQTSAAEETDVTSQVVEMELNVPEGPDGATCTLTIKDPDDAWLTHSNKPVKITVGGVVVIDGIADAPKWKQSISDETKRLEIVVHDNFKRLRNYRYQSGKPLDALDLSVSIEGIIDDAACGPHDVEDAAYELPSAGSPAQGDWNVLVESGMTAADALIRLHEDYCGNWFYAYVPQIGDSPALTWRSPAGLDDTPVLTLYETTQDAIDGGVASDDAWTRVFRAWDEDLIECEGNDLRVTGWDPRARRPLQAKYTDAVSQDPEVVPADRPENWVGEVWRVGVVDPYLATQDDCNRAADLLGPRVTRARRIGEFDAEILFKDTEDLIAWKGDALTIGDKGDWRILGFRARWVVDEDAPGPYWRDAHYLVEKLDAEAAETPSGYRTLATNLGQLRGMSDAMRTARTALFRPVVRELRMPEVS